MDKGTDLADCDNDSVQDSTESPESIVEFIEDLEADGVDVPESVKQYVFHREESITIRPIPEASELAEYEAAIPGSGDRIITMAENQSRHRQEMEKKQLDLSAECLQLEENNGHEIAKMGAMSARLIAIFALAGGMVCVIFDKEIYGLTAIITALGSIVGVFAYGSVKKKPPKEKSVKGKPESDIESDEIEKTSKQTED